MTFGSVLLSSVILASLIQAGFAANNTHAAYLASVSTYRPGRLQPRGRTDALVDYFLQARDLCRVTVFKAVADDEALVSPPERVEIDAAAGGRSELAAGDGSALAIASTADANAIKIAPQYHHPTNVTIDAMDSAQE
jgi:hypothetical protein